MRKIEIDNCGIYFDSNGFAVVKYLFNGQGYKISYVKKSQSPSIENLKALITCLKPLNKILINDSIVACQSLYDLGIKVDSKIIPISKERLGETCIKDCFETIKALLTDKKIEIDCEYEKIFSDSIKNFVIESDEIDHLIYALFYGLAIQFIEELKNQNRGRLYLGGGISPCYWE